MTTRYKSSVGLTRRESVGAVTLEKTEQAPTYVESRKQQNVLFIVSDDLNMHLGCYGYPWVHSPNLDRLAYKGVRFDRAYCQYPLCGPSRASFMTGLRPDTTGVITGPEWLRDKLPDVVTMPQLFKESGYRTARVIKVFHDARATPDDPYSWDLAIEPCRSELGKKGPRREYTPDIEGLQLGASVMAEGDDDDQPDGLGAKEAVRFLQSYGHEKPFFLAVGFRMPHIEWVVPKRYFELYDPDKIELPEIRTDAWDNVPTKAITLKDFNYRLDEKTWREALCAYYAATSFMDAQVGRLLDALDNLHLAENTIVVFISDNGWHVGEHGLWHKFTLFEESAHVPMIIYAPGAIANGRACSRLVEFVDICPTVADLCGLQAPADVEGISLRPLLDDPTRPWKKAAFTQHIRGADMGRSIKTERWRFTTWGDSREDWELYDHESDPHEFVNLARDPKYADKANELLGLLKSGWRAVLP